MASAQHGAEGGEAKQPPTPVFPAAPMGSGDPAATTSVSNPNSRQTVFAVFADLLVSSRRICFASAPGQKRTMDSSAARVAFFVDIVWLGLYSFVEQELCFH